MATVLKSHDGIYIDVENGMFHIEYLRERWLSEDSKIDPRFEFKRSTDNIPGLYDREVVLLWDDLESHDLYMIRQQSSEEGRKKKYFYSLWYGLNIPNQHGAEYMLLKIREDEALDILEQLRDLYERWKKKIALNFYNIW